MNSWVISTYIILLVSRNAHSAPTPLLSFVKPYQLSTYRYLQDAPVTALLGFTNQNSKPLVSLACQDEFGLPDSAVQSVGLWSWNEYTESAQLMKKTTITNASPWYNKTSLNTGYRYANISPTFLDVGVYYVVGCTIGLPNLTPYYRYLRVEFTPILEYYSGINSGSVLGYPSPANANAGVDYLIMNGFYSDGSQILNILSIGNDFTTVKDSLSMRGIRFYVTSPLSVTALGVEVTSGLPFGVVIGIWKSGNTTPLFAGTIPENAMTRNGYAFLELTVDVYLETSSEYRVAALLGSNYPYLEHTDLRTVSSTLWSDLGSVFDSTSRFGYPNLTSAGLKYSCVSLEVVRALPAAIVSPMPLPSPSPAPRLNPSAPVFSAGPAPSPPSTTPESPSGLPKPVAPSGNTFPMWGLAIIIPFAVLLCILCIAAAIWIYRKRDIKRRKELRANPSLVERVPVSSTNTAVSVTGSTLQSSVGFMSHASDLSQEESVLISTTGEEFAMSQKTLGQGAFGVVRMGVDSNGLMVAIKAVPKGTSTEEIAILQGFVHPNIITLRGIAHSQVYTYIIMECATGGSLSNMIAAFGKLRVSDAKRFTRDILQGLAALHEKGVIHRDIKPGNVLYMADGVAKLADFGIVSPTDKTMTSDKGTLRYMAPEAIKGERLTTQVDIWAVGLTLIEMLSGYRPWHTIKEDYGVVAHLHGSNENSEYPFPEDIPMDAREFISKMLHFDPKIRSTAHGLLSDPYLQRRTSVA